MADKAKAKAKVVEGVSAEKKDELVAAGGKVVRIGRTQDSKGKPIPQTFDVEVAE